MSPDKLVEILTTNKSTCFSVLIILHTLVAMMTLFPASVASNPRTQATISTWHRGCILILCKIYIVIVVAIPRLPWWLAPAAMIAIVAKIHHHMQCRAYCGFAFVSISHVAILDFILIFSMTFLISFHLQLNS